MDDVLYPSESLNTRILDVAHCLQIPLKTARIHSSDVFYTEDNVDGYKEIIKKHQCECVEMGKLRTVSQCEASWQKCGVSSDYFRLFCDT